MLVQKPAGRWETRPLECWQKAKELRRQFYEKEKDATEEHTFLIHSGGKTALMEIGDAPRRSAQYLAMIAAHRWLDGCPNSAVRRSGHAPLRSARRLPDGLRPSGAFHRTSGAPLLKGYVLT